MATYHTLSLSQQRGGLRRNRNYAKLAGDNSAAGLGPIANTLFIIVLVGLLGLIYLTQITKTSNYGYEINSLKLRQQQLVKNNQSLTVESARLQALERIKTSSVAKSMDKISGADYANR